MWIGSLEIQSLLTVAWTEGEWVNKVLLLMGTGASLPDSPTAHALGHLDELSPLPLSSP